MQLLVPSNAKGLLQQQAEEVYAKEHPAYDQLISSFLPSSRIDSGLSSTAALDVPLTNSAAKIHRLMRPHLVVMPVVYCNFAGKPSIGQLVVHRSLVGTYLSVFEGMRQNQFPIQSVIPQAYFDYNDTRSMEANNSSAYRPEALSQHLTGGAFDLNPRQNPYDITAYDPASRVAPAGAIYNPRAKGAIVKGGAVHRLFVAAGFVWGGSWGDPTEPAPHFYRKGFFDWHHFDREYDEVFQRSLPAGVMAIR